MKLAKEIQKNSDVVKEAVAAKRKLVTVEQEVAVTRQALEEEKDTSKRLRTERKQYYNLLRHHRSQSSDLRQRVTKIEDVEQIKAEHEQLWEEFDKLQEEADSLRAEVAEKDDEIDRLSAAADPLIQTKDNSGEYIPEFCRLVYRLLGKNIPHHHVSSTIADILQFAERKASDLPSTKSIGRMNIERGSVALQHVAVSLVLKLRLALQ